MAERDNSNGRESELVGVALELHTCRVVVAGAATIRSHESRRVEGARIY